MDQQQLRAEVQAFIDHPSDRPSHVPDAQPADFDVVAFRRVGDLVAAGLRDGLDPDELATALQELIRTSRRPSASMPFDARFGNRASNDWSFFEMGLPVLAEALRQQLSAGAVREVLDAGLDVAALARDHEMMVALGSGGFEEWVTVLFDVLDDAIDAADADDLQRFVDGGRIIDRTWPAVSQRIALSRVLGPPLKYIREGERLLELDLPPDVRAEIERASSGFGCMTPAPLYRDWDFLYGGFDHWHSAAFECAATVDGGPDAARLECERIEPQMREDARLLPLHKWLETGGALANRYLRTLLQWRLLLTQAACRLELLAGRSRPTAPERCSPTCLVDGTARSRGRASSSSLRHRKGAFPGCRTNRHVSGSASASSGVSKPSLVLLTALDRVSSAL